MYSSHTYLSPLKTLIKNGHKFKYMNENLYGMFDKVLQSEYSLQKKAQKRQLNWEKVQNTGQWRPIPYLME